MSMRIMSSNPYGQSFTAGKPRKVTAIIKVPGEKDMLVEGSKEKVEHFASGLEGVAEFISSKAVTKR